MSWFVIHTTLHKNQTEFFRLLTNGSSQNLKKKKTDALMNDVTELFDFFKYILYSEFVTQHKPIFPDSIQSDLNVKI